MDVASTAFSITVNIVKFLSEHGDKDVLQEQITDIVIQIQNVIKPLLLHDFRDEALRHVLRSLNTVLVSVDNHMRAWTESRRRRMIALVNPWAVTGEIKEDRQQLMNQYQLLTGAMQTYDFIRGYNLLPSGNNPATHAHPSTSVDSQNLASAAQDDEASMFWHARIGGDQEVVESRRLCDDLASWLNMKFDGLSRRRLLFRLDENDTGYVTLKTLQDLVRNGRLREAVLVYSSGFPLLIWISDDLKINAPKVAFAREKGVSVIQLASTSSAKAWIKMNKTTFLSHLSHIHLLRTTSEILQSHDRPSDLRFISDQSRWELDSGSKPFLNRRAGNKIIKFIRHEGFRAPVLIYTSKKTLPATRYVESYESAGSIAGNYEAYNNYILALASRRNDDRGWMRCSARS